jgi:hypothetical protein
LLKLFFRNLEGHAHWVNTFSDTRHTVCAMYLWAALQIHRILQGYIDLDFIAHPEVSSVVVEHMIQTSVPMVMYEALKTETIRDNASAKAPTTAVEKLESNMARQSESIIKLQQDVKEAPKK